MNELNVLTIVAIIITSLFVGYVVGNDFDLPSRSVNINWTYTNDLGVELNYSSTYKGFTYIRNGEPLFIVVQVAGRTAEEIHYTFLHEMAHVFNRWERSHFYKYDFVNFYGPSDPSVSTGD